jgi:phosphoserine phosphatase
MNLIIQALHDIPAALLKRLADLTLASRTEQIATHAYRLTDAKPHDNVADYCYEHRLDYGYVRPSQHLSNFGLVVIDMDSTLITIECIDEIADIYQLKPQVSSITEAAMSGKIDFAESLRRRMAMLEGLDESVLQRVYDERLQLSPGAEKMLAKLKEHGIKTLLVSGGFAYFTGRLKARLGLDFAHGNMPEIVNGKLTGKVLGKLLDAQAKADFLVHTRDELELNNKLVIAIGDGANDLKMMSQASVSIAYHAKPVVRSQATYAFNFVGLDGLITLFGG